jgi:plastocyanin
VRVFGLSLLLALAAAVLPAGGNRPAAQQTATVRGRVVIDIPPAGRRPSSAYPIRQRGETFLPRVVAVPVGSFVDFPNDDAIYHNVFSLSRARTFNLGRYPKGESRAVRFDKAGTVKVFCDIHSHMTATVVVFNHPWFTAPEAEGTFELSGLPVGDLQITAWHERLGDTTLRVRAEAGRPASIEFVLPVPAQ